MQYGYVYNNKFFLICILFILQILCYLLFFKDVVFEENYLCGGGYDCYLDFGICSVFFIFGYLKDWGMFESNQ